MDLRCRCVPTLAHELEVLGDYAIKCLPKSAKWLQGHEIPDWLETLLDAEILKLDKLDAIVGSFQFFAMSVSNFYRDDKKRGMTAIFSAKLIEEFDAFLVSKLKKAAKRKRLMDGWSESFS